MSRTDWSVFNVESGALLPYTYPGDRAYAEMNAPAGHAVVEGRYDHRNQAVVLVTDDYGAQQPVVVDLPQTGDPLDEPRRRRLWPVLRAMAALDAQRVRPMAEAALAMAGGDPLSQAAKDKLLATEQQLRALRDRRADIMAATTLAELDAL